MTIQPCNFQSGEVEPFATVVTCAITNETTPDEFDRLLIKYPDYRLSYGGRCGFTALTVAARLGNVPLIHHIVKLGGKPLVHLGTSSGWTPLYCAANCEDRENGFLAAKALLSFGAKINKATFSGTGDSQKGDTPRLATPLWAATVKTQNLKLVKLLLLYGGAIHPDTAYGFYDPLTDVPRLPNTLINQALDELRRESESWTAFNICNRLLPENKLPKIINVFIADYFRSEMHIPNRRPCLKLDHKPLNLPSVAARIRSWITGLIPRFW